MTRACSSVDRVPGYEPVGRRFESRQARQHDTLRFAVRVCFYVYIYGNTDLRLFSQKKAHKSQPFFCENPIYSVYPYTSLRKETDHAEF